TFLLVISILAYGWFLRMGALVVITFVLVVCALVRSSLSLRYQIAITLVLWFTVPIFRATPLSRPITDSIFFFGVIWAGLAYSAIYLLVEHRRAGPTPLSWLKEVLYLLALPRIVEPFFQPISPKYLYAREQRTPTPRLIFRATGLALWGLGLSFAHGYL